MTTTPDAAQRKAAAKMVRLLAALKPEKRAGAIVLALRAVVACTAPVRPSPGSSRTMRNRREQERQ
jgi:hypothetical protein